MPSVNIGLFLVLQVGLNSVAISKCVGGRQAAGAGDQVMDDPGPGLVAG